MSNNILIIPSDGLEHMFSLFDQVTEEKTGCGIKTDTHWVINLTREPFFNQDGTQQVNEYNHLIHTSLQRKFTDLLITFKNKNNVTEEGNNKEDIRELDSERNEG